MMETTKRHVAAVAVIIKYGAYEALFLEHLAYWIDYNIAEGKNFHDGYYWTYNSYEAFTKMLPYFTERQLRYMIKKLIDKGAIKRGNYNERKYDKTSWYTIVDKELIDFYELSRNNNDINQVTKLSHGYDKCGQESLKNTKKPLTNLVKATDKFVGPIPGIKHSSINTKKEEKSSNSTKSTGEEKKEAAGSVNGDQKTLLEKVELMNPSLSNSTEERNKTGKVFSENEEKKNAPGDSGANLFQGKLDIRTQFTLFQAFYKSKFNFSPKSFHFDAFLQWYKKTGRAERLGCVIEKSLFLSILEKDFKYDFKKAIADLKENIRHEQALRAIREKDKKQDSALTGVNIPGGNMLNFIDGLRQKAKDRVRV